MPDPLEATCQIVDSLESTRALVETIMQNHRAQKSSREPFLHVDLEGVSLSRNGSVSLVTVYVEPENKAYLVDVHTLQAAAFTAKTPSGDSLGSVFKDAAVPKVFFDVRNDADALYHHYRIALKGVEDVQLMEMATRASAAGDARRRCDYVQGLARCLLRDAPLSPLRKHRCEQTKQQGLRLFHPDKGGAYAVFNQRPLDPALVRYCANDVQYLPLLRATYLAKLSTEWRQRVDKETAARLLLARDPAYNPHADSKKMSPWAKEPEMTEEERMARDEDRYENYLLERGLELERLQEEFESNF